MSDLDETIASEIASLRNRVALLEKQEYLKSNTLTKAVVDALAVAAGSLIDGLIVLDVAVAAASGAQVITSGAGVWETDATVTQTITVPAGKTATIIAAYQARWFNGTAQRAASASFQGLLDAVAGQEDGYLGNYAVNEYVGAAVINYWTAVAAGAHTIALQYRRFNAGDTVNITRRVMWAVAIEE